MWMDIAQDGEQEPRSDEEDTVYDRTNPFSKNHNNDPNSPEVRVMLDEQDTRCGILGWRPLWLQKFGNKTLFSVLFTVVGIIHGSMWTYYTANISTVEKRFGMDSTTSGVLLFVNELAQVLITILFTYFGFRRRRAAVLTLGLVLTSLSCFLMASPHFFLGSGELSLQLVKNDIKPTVVINDHLHPSITIEPPSTVFNNVTFTSKMIESSTSKSSFPEIPNTLVLTSSVSPSPEVNSNSSRENQNQTQAQNNSSESASKIFPQISLSTTSQFSDDTSTTATVSKRKKRYLQKEDYSHNHDDDETEDKSVPPGAPHVNDEITHLWPICQRHTEDIHAAEKFAQACDRKGFERKFAFTFMFLGNLVGGIGSMLFLLSGGPFSEDSTILPNELPRIFGITMSIRLIGTFLGYLFAWSCLSEFINPLLEPIQMDYAGSRWLGAYWLGWTSLGIFMALMAFFFSLFPRQSPRDFLKKRSITHDTGVAMLMLPNYVPFFGGAELKTANPFPNILSIPTVAQGLSRNSIYVYLVLSTMAHVFVGVGYSTFLPKYLEFMFRLRSADSAMLTAISGVPFQVAGLMLSGAFIARYLPSPKEITHWNAIVTALQILCLMVMAFFGCSTEQIDLTFLEHPDHLPSSTNSTSGTPLPTMQHCCADCDCPILPFLPVCDRYTEKVFYSPCHAGCEQIVVDNNSSTVSFHDCSCVEFDNITLLEGFCPESDKCGNGLIEFLALLCVIQLLRGSGVVGRMLISYKSIQTDQRTAIIGFTMIIMSVFSVIPGPIVFGSLFESACSVRAESCGNAQVGNCWLYKDSTLRFAYNLGAAAFLVIAFVLDALLWKNRDVHELRIYDGELRHLTPTASSSGETHARFANVSLS